MKKGDIVVSHSGSIWVLVCNPISGIAGRFKGVVVKSNFLSVYPIGDYSETWHSVSFKPTESLINLTNT